VNETKIETKTKLFTKQKLNKNIKIVIGKRKKNTESNQLYNENIT